MQDKLLTTNQAAQRLGLTAIRVRQLIKAGRLPSQQFGRDHVIREEDLKLVADRKSGRPPKTISATNGQPAKAAKKATAKKVRLE
jgi:excisionase family DNA binding protein